jgi:hypothetical protein
MSADCIRILRDGKILGLHYRAKSKSRPRISERFEKFSPEIFLKSGPVAKVGLMETPPLRRAIMAGQIEIESILRLAGATNEGKEGGLSPGPFRR